MGTYRKEMLVASLKRNLSKVIQEERDWCIPASIIIALRYLNSSFSIAQKELVDMLEGKPANFQIFKDILENDSRFKEVSFEHILPTAIEKMKDDYDRMQKIYDKYVGELDVYDLSEEDRLILKMAR